MELRNGLVFAVILFCILQADSKKTGGSIGSRGHSSSRISSSRSSSSGTFGGSKPSGGNHGGRTGGSVYHPTHTGGASYPGTNRGGALYPSGGGYKAPSSGRPIGGGYSGQQTGWHNRGGFNSGYSSSSPYRNKPRFSSGNVKNMLIGAGAGILAWEAGKHLIRSVTRPFMYHGRNYYWGQDYYRPPPGIMSSSSYHMCRHPLESDPEFRDVYFQGGSTRPKEVVWSCGYGEHCCGMDCCQTPRPAYYYGSAMSSYSVYNVGYIILLVAGLIFTI